MPSVLKVSASASPDNPLIVQVEVSLDTEAPVYIEYENQSAGRFRTATTAPAAIRHTVALVRLRPATTYSYRAYAVDPGGAGSEGPGGEFTTGPLPEALATIELAVQGGPTLELVLMDYRDAASSYILVLDDESQIVWYYANPNPFPPAASGIQAVRQSQTSTWYSTWAAPVCRAA